MESPQHLKKGLGGWGFCLWLGPYLIIIPRIEETNQEGANIRKGTEAVETSFSLTNSLLTVVDRPVREM